MTTENITLCNMSSRQRTCVVYIHLHKIPRRVTFRDKKLMWEGKGGEWVFMGRQLFLYKLKGILESGCKTVCMHLTPPDWTFKKWLRH